MGPLVDADTGELVPGPRRASDRLVFPGNVYGFVNQTESARHARAGSDARESLLLAAMGRANNSGHAEFDQGELAGILGYSGDNPVRKLIRKAAGEPGEPETWLSPASTPRCLWLNRAFWTRRKGGVTECQTHKTRGTYWTTGLPSSYAYRTLEEGY